MAGRRVLCLFALLLLASAASANLKVNNFERRVDMASHIVTTFDTITVENAGPDTESSIKLCVPENHVSHQAFLEVRSGGKATKPLEVKAVRAAGQPANVSCFEATLTEPLGAGATAELRVKGVYTHLLKPRPAVIKQGDPQLVEYYSTAYLVSPYPVASQKTTLVLPQREVEFFTNVAPVKKNRDQIVYGPYSNIAPFTMAPIRIHGQSNVPFAVVTKLEREVEVSHWGNIYVQETYSMRHAGAQLSGEWSRYRLQTDPMRAGLASFRRLTATLPPQAHTLYFKDEIGNVSTSNVRYGTQKVEVALEPRYPLFGGWTVDFVFGYSLPLRDFALRVPSGGHNQVGLLFGCPFPGLVVDELVIKVVLPEGSTDIKAHVPFDVEQWTDVKYTYLDTSGRPVIALRKRNIVDEHNVLFNVTYKSSFLSLLWEPFLLVTTFASLFAAVMVYVRCEFTISRDNKWRASEVQQRAHHLAQQAAAVLADRHRNLRQLQAAGASGLAQVESALAASLRKLKDLAHEVGEVAGKKGGILRELLDKEKALQAAVVTLVTRHGVEAGAAAPQDGEKKLMQQEKVVADAEKEITALTDSLLSTK